MYNNVMIAQKFLVSIQNYVPRNFSFACDIECSIRLRKPPNHYSTSSWSAYERRTAFLSLSRVQLRTQKGTRLPRRTYSEAAAEGLHQGSPSWCRVRVFLRIESPCNISVSPFAARGTTLLPNHIRNHPVVVIYFTPTSSSTAAERNCSFSFPLPTKRNCRLSNLEILALTHRLVFSVQ